MCIPIILVVVTRTIQITVACLEALILPHWIGRWSSLIRSNWIWLWCEMTVKSLNTILKYRKLDGCAGTYPWHVETWRLADWTGTDWSKSSSAWCPSTIATMTNWCLIWLISFPISDWTYRTQWTTIIWTSWIIGAIIECSRRQIWVTLIKC